MKTQKFKLLYFRNETCYANENSFKDLLCVYLQPSVNKNSLNPAILTLQFDDVTVKAIYKGTLSLLERNHITLALILGLQPRDKAAMLGVNTLEFFLEEFT